MSEKDSSLPNTVQGPVVLIDDERAMRDSVSQWLELAGIEVMAFSNGEDALKVLDDQFTGVVVTDLRLTAMDGMQIFKAVNAIDPEIPTLMITGHGDVNTAVSAMREGIYDFIEKPFQPEHLTSTIQRALEKRTLLLNVRRLKARVANDAGLDRQLAGECESIRRIRDQITNLADVDVSVLLIGETGTGKSVIARCLHYIGHRNDATFTTIDCGAIPADSVERELYGEVGHTERASPFELATGGTVLLDELANMPSEQQIKLLHLLEDREVKRVGDQQHRPFDVRLIGAVDDSINQALEAGSFRKDLYFRLNTIEIRIPPLRERDDDVVILFRQFIERAARVYDRELPSLELHDIAALKRYEWPGNVRELESIAERFVLYEGQAVEQLLSAQPVQSNTHLGNRKLIDAVNAFEKSLIEQALHQSNGDMAMASELLGLPRRTLNDKLQKHVIDRAQYRTPKKAG